MSPLVSMLEVDDVVVAWVVPCVVELVEPAVDDVVPAVVVEVEEVCGAAVEVFL